MTYTYTIDEIKTMYLNGSFTHPFTVDNTIRKLPDDYVISDDLTIKENRERVQNHNKMVEKHRRDHIIKQDELFQNMRNLVREAVTIYYGMNEKQALIVEDYCWSGWHHYITDYLDHVDWLADLTQQVLEASK